MSRLAIPVCIDEINGHPVRRFWAPDDGRDIGSSYEDVVAALGMVDGLRAAVLHALRDGDLRAHIVTIPSTHGPLVIVADFVSQGLVDAQVAQRLTWYGYRLHVDRAVRDPGLLYLFVQNILETISAAQARVAVLKGPR